MTSKADLIKDMVSTKNVLDYYGIYPTKRCRYKYHCFMHEDKNPSAGINQRTGRYHCFSCGETMDIFDIVQYKEKCDLTEAIEKVDAIFKLGIIENIKEEEYKEWLEQNKKEKEKKLLEERLERELTVMVSKRLHQYQQFEKEYSFSFDSPREDSQIFFYAIKEQERLDYIYNIMSDNYVYNPELYHSIGNNKATIVEKWQKGELFL